MPSNNYTPKALELGIVIRFTTTSYEYLDLGRNIMLMRQYLNLVAEYYKIV